MDVFWTLPPVTRTITALAVVISALGYSGMINLSYYVFLSDYIFTIRQVPQVWRLFTSFLITKPKFAILLDPYFLYQYGSGLERESTRFSQPGDFFVYTFFLCSVILATAGILLKRYTFLQALSLAFAYTYAQDNPTRQVSFFIITFDAKYLPFGMLFITFIIDGPDAALTQATGLVAAHLYDFLTRIWPTFGGGTNYIFTPVTVKRWFGGNAGSVQQRAYGTARQGRTADNVAGLRSAGAASATGRSTGFGGPGQRLGE
ncbi:DER1-domain-containing protein [Melanomma pulvis-pyrius CBS 109.77]|uniref:Derlin n=1 Tax=Melanomma pulvis-pyrius CBS 109.77 TaxID=1314802 RepID=A0A6A6WX50_9PLEO|nr:DER1-domain-containing protein [Melanomma pulvis-pyrius CBS 109.77]